MKRIVFALLALLVLALAAGAPSGAAASEATDVIKYTVEKALAILDDPELKGPEHKEERRKRVMEVIEERFDFEELSRRTLARHWRDRTPEERREFVDLYTRFLQDFYMDKIEDEKRDKVLFMDERVRGKVAEVKTLVITTTGTEIPILYRMKRNAAEWKVYDVIIEGVSLVRSYRGQFNEIIQSSSYEELVKKLREKISGE